MKFEDFTGHIIDMTNELWPRPRRRSLPERESGEKFALRIREIATTHGIWTPSGCVCKDEDVWCRNFLKHPLVVAMQVMHMFKKSPSILYFEWMMIIEQYHRPAWRHFEETSK